ncbi:MAG: hypothetical protein JF595_14275 [Sphingomonadales bacterium]|nr:hypothetical protein [Sphingomonadales bacterium]
MNSHRLILIVVGAVAVAGIALTLILAHKAQVPAPALIAMLLGTYALGLGLGGMALNRRG